MPEDEITLDVAGQPGGPSPEEQAAVDAEQLALIEQIKADRAPAEAEEARLRDEKLQRAIEAQSERQSMAERLKLVEARLTVLEAKP